MTLDKGIHKYDPHMIAEEKKQAIIDYRKCFRVYNQLVDLKDKKINQKYLMYRFQSEEKNSVDDAKAKAKINEEVQEVVSQLEMADKLKDEAYAEMQRVETKIQFILDSNSIKRAEMKLSGFST